ncbi:hypothetical protein B0H11DRAFT_1329080 [Mycena galericulata]|nr:hypothetical protein B0H11DRAFT_1329080 [Mycena galericulata]
MLSCESGLLDPISKTRRQISCLKAIWCLGMMAENDLRPIQPLFFLTGSRFLPPRTPVTAQYFPSIDALAHWNNLCSLQGHVDKINRSLQEGGEALAQDRVPDIKRYCDELKDFLTERSRCKWSGRIPIAVEGVDLDLHQLSAQSTIASFQWIFKVSRIMRALRSITSETQARAACWNEVHYQIVLSFLQQSAALDSPPYEFELTCKTLLASLERKNLPAGFVAKVVEDNVRKAAQTKNSWINHVDTILGILLPWFDNDEVESDVAEHVTDSVVEFVNNRDLNQAICRVLQDCNLTRVWNRIAARVETCRPDCRGDVSKAMWHLAILFPGQSNPGPRLNARPNFNGRTLSVVCVDPYSPSVIALLKMRILSAFEQTHIRSNLQAIETSIMGNVQTAVEDKLSTMAHDWPLLSAVCTLLSPITTSGPPIQPLELFPAYTRQNQGYREWCEQALAVVRKALRLTPHLEGRFEEARLAITTEFMQACLNADDSPLPYNALETFNDILLPVSISYPAHRDNQRNFATALRELAGFSTRTSEHLELLRAVIESGIFGVEGLPWLSDHEAVATVKSVIQKYLALVDGEATTTTQSRRLENVLNWLELKEVDYVSDFLHPLALNHVGTSKSAY